MWIGERPGQHPPYRLQIQTRWHWHSAAICHYSWLSVPWMWGCSALSPRLVDPTLDPTPHRPFVSIVSILSKVQSNDHRYKREQRTNRIPHPPYPYIHIWLHLPSVPFVNHNIVCSQRHIVLLPSLVILRLTCFISACLVSIPLFPSLMDGWSGVCLLIIWLTLGTLLVYNLKGSFHSKKIVKVVLKLGFELDTNTTATNITTPLFFSLFLHSLRLSLLRK